MEKKTEIDKRVEQLYLNSGQRKYTGRKMKITIESLQEEENLHRVVGVLDLAVSETPEDSESWVEKNFTLMVLDKRPEDAIANILMHMNSIPVEFGDMIFEPDFDELMKYLKTTDD